MNWKKYLESEGFKWSQNNHNYYKSLGFGNKIEVSMLVRGLFEVKKYGLVKFSHFINSFEEFKKIIDNTLKN
jgi:hypothetical protein